ncbi:unnamed protein product [Rangifer tarandus platyrhynchus]|uniref:Uncharacterized protein n=1 Tax=Rangifer tarandus platyrhynchus TaxID=3082113 RepID=A0ABN8YQN4_RANTA|nr:unnamed protein product [Rangifer tarandus platyrhynchus]
MQETQQMQVRSLGGEDPLDKATHSGRLAWRTPWREESGGLQSTGRGCHESDMTEQDTSLPERYPVVSGKFASQTESDRKRGEGRRAVGSPQFCFLLSCSEFPLSPCGADCCPVGGGGQL